MFAQTPLYNYLYNKFTTNQSNVVWAICQNYNGSTCCVLVQLVVQWSLSKHLGHAPMWWICCRLSICCTTCYGFVVQQLLQHPLNSLFSWTNWVSRHQKGRTIWILMKREIMGWQWHQLDHMQIIYTLFQTDTMPVPHHSQIHDNSNQWSTHTNAHTQTTILRLYGLCPGQTGWAGTRRNIHPLTPIVVNNRLLSTSSI